MMEDRDLEIEFDLWEIFFEVLLPWSLTNISQFTTNKYWKFIEKESPYKTWNFS